MFILDRSVKSRQRDGFVKSAHALRDEAFVVEAYGQYASTTKDEA